MQVGCNIKKQYQCHKKSIQFSSRFQCTSKNQQQKKDCCCKITDWNEESKSILYITSKYLLLLVYKYRSCIYMLRTNYLRSKVNLIC